MGQMFSKRADGGVDSDLESEDDVQDEVRAGNDSRGVEVQSREVALPGYLRIKPTHAGIADILQAEDGDYEKKAPISRLVYMSSFKELRSNIGEQFSNFTTAPNSPEPSQMITIGEDEELPAQAEDMAPVSLPSPPPTPGFTSPHRVKVRPLSKSIVRPETPTEKKWLKLSNLDRVVNPTFSSVIHYFNDAVTEDRTFIDVVGSLKSSLAKTLVEFYPLAGRLTLREDGVVDLLCDDEGAIFIEAVVDAELKDWGGAAPTYLLSGLEVAKVGPGPTYVPDQLTPMPVTVIQVTMFRCGTIAIGTNWHHTVADGFSGTHFMRSWAEIAQGKPISIKPDHNREILKPRDPLDPSLVYGYSTKSLEGEAAEARTSAPAKLRKFHLNKEKILELKQRANLFPPPNTPRPYTSAESVSAHLWIQMTKARAEANAYSADSAKDTITKFFMFVDGRKRLKLPAGYFGNVVCSACAVAKESDILTGQVHYAASLIRTATRNITAEYFRSLIDWVEDKGMSSAKSDHVNSLGHDVAATFWTFFPLYEIEFGWGRPVFAARNSPPRPLIDGIAMMPSATGAGDMVALLNLHSDRMSKLQRQISFATVFNQ
ncbi:hypothetical protein R1flu_022250 [Riccia fluitans]|uniref:Uncharacterized protein n=1 Tax=Riccia fluitans TaxID=41844 RepID=A0ABD1ZRQ1_9MARC